MSINGPNDSYQGFQASRAQTNIAKVESTEAKAHNKQVDSASYGPDISDRATRVLELEREYGVDLGGRPLTDKQLDRLQSLLTELDSLYTSGDLPPITERQQREFQAIERQIMSILEGANPTPLTGPELREFDDLYQQADTILGSPALSPDLQSQLQALNRQIDSVFNSSFDPAKLDAEIAHLESLFTQRDELLLGQELSFEQEQTMMALEEQIDALLGDDSIMDEKGLVDEQKTLLKLYDELDNLLGNRPLSEQQQAQLWQLDQQQLSLFKNIDTSGLSQGEQQQLEELFFRADKVLGLNAQTAGQLQRIDDLNQSIERLLQGQERTVLSAYDL